MLYTVKGFRLSGGDSVFFYCLAPPYAPFKKRFAVIYEVGNLEELDI